MCIHSIGHTSAVGPVVTILKGCQLGSFSCSCHNEQSSAAFRSASSPYLCLHATRKGLSSSSPILLIPMLLRLRGPNNSDKPYKTFTQALSVRVKGQSHQIWRNQHLNTTNFEGISVKIVGNNRMSRFT